MLIVVVECIGEWYVRTSIDKVVNLKDITHFVVNGYLCMAFRMKCLSMYVSNHYLAMFYVNLNVLLEALSFGTKVVPQPSGFLFLIRVLINDYEHCL